MGSNLTKFFGIEREEKGLITTLLIQSVFLGIFYQVFNITAHAIFLARFDETMLAKAYIISGLVGIILTYLYTILQSRVRFSIFSVLNLVVILLMFGALYFLNVAYPSDLVIIAIFVMLGPLFILAMLGFWGTAGRLFTLRQGKRLFGIIDTGLILGMIVSSFAVPALLSMKIGTNNILLVSAFSLLAAIIVQVIISTRNRDALKTVTKKEAAKSEKGIFRKDRYVKSMSIFVALSVLVAFFVMYSFMAVTRERYPGEEEMASFLGFFEGSMMIFTLIIKTFLFSYLIKNQGLKVTLALSPVLIAIFIIVAVIVGMTQGYTASTSGFMIFFLILALSRLFSKALKDTVETPAFKVLYQTLGENVRYNVQSAIDGTVNEISALVSGLLLTGLGALAFVKLIHFSWVLIAILLLWVFFAIRLYSDYRASIKKSLDASGDDDDIEKPERDKDCSITSSAFLLINQYYDLLSDPSILADPDRFKQLTEVIFGRAETDQNPDIIILLREIEKLSNGNMDVKERALELRLKFEKRLKEKGININANLVDTLENSEDKKYQLRAITIGNSPPVITDLMRLIREPDPEIKRESIYIIGRFRIKDLLPEVCDCLEIDEISKDAYSVIKSFGSEAFEALTGHFFRSSGNIKVRRLLIRLFGDTGGQDAVEFLLPRMWSIHRLLRKEAILGLIKCGYHATDDVRDRLHQEIQDIIGLLTWNLSAEISLKANHDQELIDIIQKETNWWTDFLFDIMSLIYDKYSLDKIRENLASGAVENTNFALEMIDIVVDDEIKPRLTALLDVVGTEEKVKNLFAFYPGNIPEYQELIESLINKDYNHIGVWAKVCAIKSLSKISKPENPDFLVALLFSKNQILREEAIRYLSSNYRNIYESCSNRIPDSFRVHLDLMLSGKIPDKDEVSQKVQSLLSLFPEIPENTVINLASDVKLIESPDNLDLDHNYILWPVSYDPEQAGDRIFLNWKETGSLINANELKSSKANYYKLNIDSLARLIYFEPEYSDHVAEQIENKRT